MSMKAYLKMEPFAVKILCCWRYLCLL